MSEVMKFEMASKDGIILETEGRLCEKHIQVVPRLASLTAELGGKYPVPDGYSGYGEITVNPKLKDLTVSTGGEYLVPDGYAGYGKVVFDPAVGNITITENGKYTVTPDMVGYDEIDVAVYAAPRLQIHKTFNTLGTYGNVTPLTYVNLADLGLEGVVTGNGDLIYATNFKRWDLDGTQTVDMPPLFIDIKGSDSEWRLELASNIYSSAPDAEYARTYLPDKYVYIIVKATGAIHAKITFEYVG